MLLTKKLWIFQGIMFANLCVWLYLAMLQGFSGWECLPSHSKEHGFGGCGGQVEVFVFLPNSLRLITLIGILLSIEKEIFLFTSSSFLYIWIKQKSFNHLANLNWWHLHEIHTTGHRWVVKQSRSLLQWGRSCVHKFKKYYIIKWWPLYQKDAKYQGHKGKVIPNWEGGE